MGTLSRPLPPALLAHKPGILHGQPGSDPSLPCPPGWKPTEFSSSDIFGVICLGNWPWPIDTTKNGGCCLFMSNAGLQLDRWKSLSLQVGGLAGARPLRVGDKRGSEWAGIPGSRGRSHYPAPGCGPIWSEILTAINSSNGTANLKEVLEMTPNSLHPKGKCSATPAGLWVPGQSETVRTWQVTHMSKGSEPT